MTDKLEMNPCSVFLTTANGERVSVQGECHVEISFGDIKVKQNVLVANIQNECIMGLNFMRNHRCDILLRQMKLKINNKHISCFTHETMIHHSCKVVLSETINIPPNSEYIAPARVVNLLHEGEVVILESIPNLNEKHDVLIPKILVKVESGTVPVLYLNLRDEHVKVFKGTNIATIETIAGIEQSVSNQSTNSGNVNDVKARDRT